MPVPQFVKTRARKAAIPAALVGGLALLFAWMLNHLGAGIGTGNGGQANPNTGQAIQSTTAPAAPVEVEVRGDGYWVDDVQSSIEKIVAAAAQRGGPVAVEIIAGPDSRLGAERDLENALDQAHLAWSLQAHPVAAP